MSLAIYKEHFDNSYQETFNKVNVAKEIVNMRFEPVLKYGESVERVAFDISGVYVRDTVRGAASTIDSISDTSELLTINLEKEIVFHMSDGEAKQAGPLNPSQVIGREVAIKLSNDWDARCFAETRNALYDFDNGDLTTLTSSGTAITLSTTTVPQMISRMPAKLQAQNQMLTNLVFVVDPFIASDIEQYIMSKSIDLAGFVLKNGFSGPIKNADLYISNNLTGEAVFAMATQPTDGDTVTIGGVTFTFKTVLGSTAGNVLIGGSADAARANLAALINAPGTTTANGVALSAANQAIIQQQLRLTATNDNTANTMTVVGVGSGALVVSETLTDGTDTWTKNFLHCYYGKKGAIDAVMQDMKEVDIRPTSDRRGNNIFSSYLGGIKTFADGAKKFLDVLIAR